MRALLVLGSCKGFQRESFSGLKNNILVLIKKFTQAEEPVFILKETEDQNNYLKDILLGKFKENGSFINQAYDSLEKYMSTDLTPRMMSRIALNLTKYEEVNAPVLTGKNSMGEFGFIEFRLDQSSLDKAVRELFYDEVK